MRRAVSAIVAVLIAALLPTPATAATVPLTGDGIVAHRGGGGEAPENSLAAYRNAVDQGVAVVETDVRFTLDGVAVMSHDDTLPSRCAPAGRLHLMTYEQVKLVRCSGEPIPTLAETIAVVKPSASALWVEVKAFAGETAESQAAHARQAAEQLLAAGMVARTVLCSNKWQVMLPVFRAVSSGFRLQVVDLTPSLARIREAKRLGAGDYTLFVDVANAYLLSYARSLGLRIVLWGTDRRDEIAYARDSGAPLIATDRPTLTRPLLLDPNLLVDKHAVYTPIVPVTVSSAWHTKGVRSYPKVMGTAVPVARLAMLASITLRVSISSGNAKGFLSIGPSGSPLAASTLIRMPSGSRTLTVRVSPGDGGRLRVYTTAESARVSIKVLGYTNLSY